MKKQGKIFRFLSLIVCSSVVFSVGCGGNGGGGHTHIFDQKVEEEQYFKSEKTCTEAKQYYYSCTCGEKGDETFSVGMKGVHSYTASVADEQYVKTPATCQSQAVYYMSCVYCGRSSNLDSKTFKGGEFGDHNYTQKVASEKYLVSEATFETAAVYYKSCVCGLVGTETFTDGKPLRDLTEEEKEGYKPISLTMTLYDSTNSIYGFTYHTKEKPLRPVIQIEKGNALTENAQEISALYQKWSSYDKDKDDKDYSISYYVAKAEIELEPLTTYTYRVYDKYAAVGSEPVTFQTKDTKATSFSFSHMSDTQSVASGAQPDTGLYFREVLGNLNTDFILHTGDVVEVAKYEYEWDAMLHGNFEYLSKIPMMAIAGNHDAGTYYKAGSSELTKHFNNKIPDQTSVLDGYYYSFTYGNVKFIMLNTNNNNSTTLEVEQYNWLVNELQNNDSDWTIVAMHAPLYSVGQWGADPEKNEQSLMLRGQLKGIFAEYDVDIVLQGHDHLISRTNPIDKNGNPTTERWQTENGIEYSVDPSGVIYVMDGAVGTQTKSVVGVEQGFYYYAQSSPVRAWADITIDGDTLTYEVKNYNGVSVNSIKRWGIKKSA